jgi:hypothetical protein
MSDPGADQTPALLLKREPPPPEDTPTPNPPHMSAPEEELVLELMPPIDWEVRLELFGVLPLVGVEVTASWGPTPEFDPPPSCWMMAKASPSEVAVA